MSSSSNSRRSSRIKLPSTAADNNRDDFFYAADSLKLYGHNVNFDQFDDDDVDSGASSLPSSNGSTLDSSCASLEFCKYRQDMVSSATSPNTSPLTGHHRKLSLDSSSCNKDHRAFTPTDFSNCKNDSGSFPDADLTDDNIVTVEKEKTPTKSHDYSWQRHFDYNIELPPSSQSRQRHSCGDWSEISTESRTSTCPFGRAHNTFVTVIERRNKSTSDTDRTSSGSSHTLSGSPPTTPTDDTESDITGVSSEYSLFEDRQYDFNTWDNHTIRTFGIRVKEVQSPPSETVISSWTEDQLVERILLHNQHNLGQRVQMDKDARNFQGHVRVHINLIRPIRVGRMERPYLMSRGQSKLLFLSNLVTSLDVINALLNNLNIKDQAYKFALYEHSIEGDKSVTFRKLFPNESPIALMLSWLHNVSDSNGSILDIYQRKRIVLQENETSLVNWSAFSVPELNNFLAILDREEKEYIDNIKLKYLLMKKEIRKRMRHVEKL